MLTAADRLDDKASGFGLGADDCVTKPFGMREVATVPGVGYRIDTAAGTEPAGGNGG